MPNPRGFPAKAKQSKAKNEGPTLVLPMESPLSTPPTKSVRLGVSLTAVLCEREEERVRFLRYFPNARKTSEQKRLTKMEYPIHCERTVFFFPIPINEA
jgi:hypothetical protein